MTYFFNTCKLQGVALHLEEEKAKSQVKAILQIFKQFSEYSFRTYDIEQILKRHKISHNHDSVKRAITCLTKKNFLEKSEHADCPGPHGKDVHTWWYKRQTGEIAA